jgi:hypothetical protein
MERIRSFYSIKRVSNQSVNRSFLPESGTFVNPFLSSPYEWFVNIYSTEVEILERAEFADFSLDVNKETATDLIIYRLERDEDLGRTG